MVENLNQIRNFCIIAHIDHGKSTLADRFLELTKTVPTREMKEQFLDQMDLERERGITIKLQPVRMNYSWNGKSYILNLIGTPGHVDFTYEVSRSLACCEGALLLIDATCGIQAQTLANFYQAREQNLKIIPVINKIDLPNAEITQTTNEIMNILGCAEKEILKISAKTGQGIKEVLEAVITRIPIPKVLSHEKNFKALIFDSTYDEYKGVIAYVRVFCGEIKKGAVVKLMTEGSKFKVIDVGSFSPKLISQNVLRAGEVGYIITGLKDITKCRVGDTIASINATKPLFGYKKIQPVVFASFYPASSSDYNLLRENLGKLKLNDASLAFESEYSPALGRGFRCGFLGLLHLEITYERLKREFGLNLITTFPSVCYKVILRNRKRLTITNPMQLPDPNQICEIQEPWVKLDIISPNKYLGGIMELVKKHRGNLVNTKYLENNRLILYYEIPLSEVICDFYDELKSISSGFASLNYEMTDFRRSDLVRLDILVAGDQVEALSKIIPKARAYQEGKALVQRLKEVIPRQNFQISLQAKVLGKIVAREDIPALRKDVTAKLYGGDYTRKRKLLEKQKRGKKKMKMLGKVRIPQEAFLAILKK